MPVTQKAFPYHGVVTGMVAKYRGSTVPNLAFDQCNWPVPERKGIRMQEVYWVRLRHPSVWHQGLSWTCPELHSDNVASLWLAKLHQKTLPVGNKANCRLFQFSLHIFRYEYHSCDGDIIITSMIRSCYHEHMQCCNVLHFALVYQWPRRTFKGIYLPSLE